MRILRTSATTLIAALVLQAGVVATPMTAMAQVQARDGRMLTEAGFQELLPRLKSDMVAAGVAPDLVDAAFAGVTFNPRVIELDLNQPEFSRPIWEYVDAIVSPKRVETGLAARARLEATLRAIESRYGPPPAVMVAIWGMESNFGAIRGDMDVVRSLASLIYGKRRERFWRAQLVAAFQIMAEGHAGAQRLTGSWASAMGHTQCIPEVFTRHAVDFNGDGRKDIWSDDPTDALATTARYLSAYDWREGQPAFLHVRLPQGFDFAGLAEKRMATEDWARAGVTLADGRPLPWGLAAAELYLPAGAQGAAILTLHNFRVIRRYNPANSYAFAVALLAERLDGGAARQFNWPRGDRPLSRAERFELQERLTALGHDTNGIDGVIGRGSRSAIRAFQASRGMVADGYASAALLEPLRAATPAATLSDAARGVAAADSTRPSASASLAPVAQPAAAPQPLDKAGVKELQARLNRLGIDVGEPDGVAGEKTAAGLRAAVARFGLPFEPEPTDLMLAALRRVAP